MSRGRKPKKDAQRRGGHEPVAIEAKVVGSHALVKPDVVAINPIMSECWDVLVGGATEFCELDVPLLENYCYWYAVYRGAVASTLNLDGSVAITVAPFDENGRPDPTQAKPNSSIRVAEKATTMLRQLGDALNISPTARIRNGLMAAMTASTAVDLAERSRREFEASRVKGALDA